MAETDNRGPVVLAVTAPLIAAATLFVFLRLVSRFAIVKRVQLDDYFILGAWVLSFGLSFTICYAVKFGLGEHQQFIAHHDRAILEKLEYTFSVLYNPCLMATKTSICVFYLTLAEAKPIFKWTTIGTMVLVNAAGLALSFLNIFPCHPITALFARPIPDSAVCIDILTLYLSSAPVNIITDLAILLLPMPLLKGMNLPKKQKIILHITFGFGIFVTAVDVVRIAYLQDAIQNRLEVASTMKSQHSTQAGTDFSWYASISFMWTAVEVNVGIMCACVPALKPLVSRFIPKMLKDTTPETSEKRPSVATAPASEMAAVDRVPSMRPNNTSVQKSSQSSTQPDEIDFAEFLTTPDMTDISQIQRTDTTITNLSALSRKGTNYGFMDMREQKSIVYMTNRESIRPIAHVTVLFFLWGFAYGLLNSLNGEFEQVSRMSPGQSIALHSAYYAGYFCGPLTVGRIVLKRWGFKACYMVGLIIYGTGTLVFWPSAVLTSFAAFFVSNFIVGFGLSILEVAANPFTALCGPARYAEVRLNLSQAVQACGTVVSPLLAKKALFKNIRNAPSLVQVQWTYLAITLFTFILAFVYYCVKLPEVSDTDLEDASRCTHPDTLDILRQKKVIWITLGLAIFAQFLFVGAQEGVSTNLDNYLLEVKPDINVDNFEAVGHTVFAISRFIAAFVGIFVKPRYMLLFFFSGAIIFSVLAMNFTGLTSAVMVICVYFFEGPLFPYIFAIPLHALGKYTKDASVLITAAISGGAVIPPIQYAVINSRRAKYSNLTTAVTAAIPGGAAMNNIIGVQYSYCVLTACFAFGTIFPLYLNFFPLARTQVDSARKDNGGGGFGASNESSTDDSSGSDRPFKFLRRRSKIPSVKVESAAVEHREMRNASL